jgi:hypothetical protein
MRSTGRSIGQSSLDRTLSAMSAVMPWEFGGIVATSTSPYGVEIGSTQSPRCSAMSSAVITPPAAWMARAISEPIGPP